MAIEEIKDPREQGTEGLEGLPSLPKLSALQKRALKREALKEFGKYAEGVLARSEQMQDVNYFNENILDVEESVMRETGLYNPEFGNSVYDDDLTYASDLQDLENFRANQQSGLLQITNGVLKGVGLAGTTFVNGTVGLVAGAGEAIKHGEFYRLHTNSVSAAMSEINESMEKMLPNYMTKEERDNIARGEWWKNMDTANFWGNDIAKNAGFTVGAYYSGAAWLKFLRGAHLVSNPAAAQVIGTTLSSVNEGAIQAHEAYKQYMKSPLAQTSLKALEEIEKETRVYTDEINRLKEELAKARYNAEYSEIPVNDPFLEDYIKRTENDIRILEDLKKEKTDSIIASKGKIDLNIKENAAKAANLAFVVEAAFLTAVEMPSLGKLYARNFDHLLTSREARDLVTLNGYRFGVNGNSGTKAGLYNIVQEGLIEEGGQKYIDETAMAIYSPEDPDAYAKAFYDKNALNERKGILKGMAEGLGKSYLDPMAWQEIFAGSLMGFGGTISFGRQNNSSSDTYLGRGKLIGMKGGFFGERAAAKAATQEAEELAKNANDQLESYITENGEVLRDLSIQDHFNRVQQGYVQQDGKFQYLNNEANTDFTLIQTIHNLGQSEFLDTIVNGIDYDSMPDSQLEEAAKAMGLMDASGKNLLTSTEEGKREARELLKKNQARMKESISNYIKALNTVNSYTAGNENFDDLTRRELAWLHFKDLNFGNRVSSIRNKYSSQVNEEISRVREEQENWMEALQNKDKALTREEKEKLQKLREIQDDIEKTKREELEKLRRIREKEKNKQTEKIKRRVKVTSQENKKQEKSNKEKKLEEAFNDSYDTLNEELERAKEGVKNSSKKEREVIEKAVEDLKKIQDLLEYVQKFTTNNNLVLSSDAFKSDLDMYKKMLLYLLEGRQEASTKEMEDFADAIRDVSLINISRRQFRERIEELRKDPKATQERNEQLENKAAEEEKEKKKQEVLDKAQTEEGREEIANNPEERTLLEEAAREENSKDEKKPEGSNNNDDVHSGIWGGVTNSPKEAKDKMEKEEEDRKEIEVVNNSNTEEDITSNGMKETSDEEIINQIVEEAVKQDTLMGVLYTTIDLCEKAETILEYENIKDEVIQRVVNGVTLRFNQEVKDIFNTLRQEGKDAETVIEEMRNSPDSYIKRAGGLIVANNTVQTIESLKDESLGKAISIATDYALKFSDLYTKQYFAMLDVIAKNISDFKNTPKNAQEGQETNDITGKTDNPVNTVEPIEPNTDSNNKAPEATQERNKNAIIRVVTQFDEGVFKEGQGVWILHDTGEGVVEFEFNDAARSRAFNNFEASFGNVSDRQVTDDGTPIITLKKGKARKEGNKWVVIEQAQLTTYRTKKEKEENGKENKPEKPASTEEKKHTDISDVHHIGNGEITTPWKPDITEFWMQGSADNPYKPSDEVVTSHSITRTSINGVETKDYTDKQKIIFKILYNHIADKGGFQAVDTGYVKEGSTIRFVVYKEVVDEINKELEKNGQSPLKEYPVFLVLEEGNVLLNILATEYTTHNIGGPNVIQSGLDTFRSEISEKASTAFEQGNNVYVHDASSTVTRMRRGTIKITEGDANNVSVLSQIKELNRTKSRKVSLAVVNTKQEGTTTTLEFIEGDGKFLKAVPAISNLENGRPVVIVESLVNIDGYNDIAYPLLSKPLFKGSRKTVIEKMLESLIGNTVENEDKVNEQLKFFNSILKRKSGSSLYLNYNNGKFYLDGKSINADSISEFFSNLDDSVILNFDRNLFTNYIPTVATTLLDQESIDALNTGSSPTIMELLLEASFTDILISDNNTWFNFSSPIAESSKPAISSPGEVFASDPSNSSDLDSFTLEDSQTTDGEVQTPNQDASQESTSSSDNSGDSSIKDNDSSLESKLEELEDLGLDSDLINEIRDNLESKLKDKLIGIVNLDNLAEAQDLDDFISILEKYRKASKTKTKTINLEKELKWFEEKFPEIPRERAIQIVENLIDVRGGGKAYGMYFRGIQTISEMSARGTLYHESFHMVFDLFTSREEKESLLKEAKDKYLKGKTFDSVKEENIEAEEQLAEAFRRYVQLEEVPIIGKAVHIFRQLKHFIQSFLGNESYMYNLFYRINNAKIDTSEVQPSSSVVRLKEEPYTQEMLDIKAKAIADGTFMKAPNGKPSNLNERQWLHVRTKAFKKWFGDWEKIAPRGDKNYDSVGGSPVALSYLLEGGPTTIKSTGYLLHGISAAFELVTNEIEEIRNKYLNQIDDNPSNFKNDTTGALQEIKTIIDSTYGQQGLNILEDILNNATGFYVKEGDKVQSRLDELNSTIKKAQYRNVSKVVDENGEPLVVYHATKAKFNIFDSSYAGTGSGNKENTKSSFYFGKHKRTVLDVFHTKSMEERNSYNVMEVFLNLRNPNIIPLDDFNKTWFDKNEYSKVHTGDGIIAVPKETPEQIYERKVKEYNKRKDEGKLSMWDRLPESPEEFMEEQLDHIYVAYSPNQIKSATDNIGTYSEDNDDIRYREVEENDKLSTNNTKKSITQEVLDIRHYNNKKMEYVNLSEENLSYLEENKISKEEYDNLTSMEKDAVFMCKI